MQLYYFLRGICLLLLFKYKYAMIEEKECVNNTVGDLFSRKKALTASQLRRVDQKRPKRFTTLPQTMFVIFVLDYTILTRG